MVTEEAGGIPLTRPLADMVDDAALVPVRRRARLKQPDWDKALRGTIEGKPFWADGFIVEMGDIPAWKTWQGLDWKDPGDISRLLPTSPGKALRPLTTVVATTDTTLKQVGQTLDEYIDAVVVGDRIVGLMTEDGDSAFLNARYFAHFQRGRHKGAQFFWHGFGDPVSVRDPSGELAGLIMPMVSGRQATGVNLEKTLAQRLGVEIAPPASPAPVAAAPQAPRLAEEAREVAREAAGPSYARWSSLDPEAWRSWTESVLRHAQASRMPTKAEWDDLIGQGYRQGFRPDQAAYTFWGRSNTTLRRSGFPIC